MNMNNNKIKDLFQLLQQGHISNEVYMYKMREIVHTTGNRKTREMDDDVSIKNIYFFCNEILL